MFKPEAAMNLQLLALAKTIQATFNKYLINHKNPCVQVNFIGCINFLVCSLGFF